MYKRFVDDTFCIFNTLSSANLFFDFLNAIHPSLKFTCEYEENGKLPFLDVLIHKEKNCFSTSIYHKPTFTGLYTRFDSFCPKQQKIALVKCLINRTRKISSDRFIEKDLADLRQIFLSNGYPAKLLDKLFHTITYNKEKPIGPQKCPVYLKLPWIGPISENYFSKALKQTIEKTFFAAHLRCIFSTKSILSPTPKDPLPASSSSCVVYEYKCECGARYVGRTTKRLDERIKQHVPNRILKNIVPTRQQPKRQCNLISVANCDSSIGKHLLENKKCAETYSNSQFKVLSKCRSLFSLKIYESMYIKLGQPDLCKQKEFIFTLALF